MASSSAASAGRTHADGRPGATAAGAASAAARRIGTGVGGGRDDGLGRGGPARCPARCCQARFCPVTASLSAGLSRPRARLCLRCAPAVRRLIVACGVGRSAACGAGTVESGNRTVKTVRPGRLSTATVPWWASTTAATMARPRPVLPARPGPRAVPAGEPFEDLRPQLGRDARAVVGDADHDRAVGTGASRVVTVRAGRGVHPGVGQQVRQHLVQPGGVARHRPPPRRAGRAATGVRGRPRGRR